MHVRIRGRPERADHRLPRVAAPLATFGPWAYPWPPVATIRRGGRHRRNVGERGAAELQFSSGSQAFAPAPRGDCRAWPVFPKQIWLELLLAA
jgi:hypothetical protein